jgi:hypothetical protein
VVSGRGCPRGVPGKSSLIQLSSSHLHGHFQTLRQARGIRWGSLRHGSILARVGASGKPGAVQSCQPGALCADRAGALGDWGIENGLHWVLDVTMNEDQLRNRKDHGPENLALLRRLALNLAKREPSKGSMRGKLKRAGWDNQFLARMLAQFASPQMR